MCAEIDKINIKVVCHGQYKKLPHKIMIDNTKYEDICQKPQDNASIAYINTVQYFEIVLGKVREYRVLHAEYGKAFTKSGDYDYIPFDYEILYPFFENYHITPTYIRGGMANEFGVFDNKTGHWTGAVGKVTSSS